MVAVYKIFFRDEVAPLVQKLTDGVIAMCGSSHCFTAHNEIKFARTIPAESKGGRAICLFLQVKPTRHGATARRPRIPKTGPKEIELKSKDDVEQALKAVKDWYQEVKEWNRPRTYQGTGDRRVVPAGQVESNRAKH